MNTEKQALTGLVKLTQVSDWERDRQRRIDGYAAVLHNLDQALAAVPAGDQLDQVFQSEIAYVKNKARGRMRAIFDETNPFVKP